MTEPSSAGNPEGAALPTDHPLGPAVPVPPREKEAVHAAREARPDGGTTTDDAPGAGGPTGASTGGPTGERADGRPGVADGDAAPRQAGDGHPGGDRRENALDPSAGSAGHSAAGIREEQGTHEAGAVPAAFDGDGAPGPGHRHPEDAADEPDAWDGGLPQ